MGRTSAPARVWRLSLTFAVALLVALAAATGASAANLFSKVPGELFDGRYAPAAALLPDGKVLIAGGFDPTESAVATAETYDPATGKFEQLSAEMKVAHGEQATVALPDGHVILIGGWSSATKSLKTAELFDPVTRTFEKLPAELTIARDGPGAVLLPSGKVFIAAGAQDSGEYTKTAETYDPLTRTFSAVKGLAFEGRYAPAVALLPNGKVLIAGGSNGAFEAMKTAELFDPATESFEKLEGAGHELAEVRTEAGVVTLQNGKVLIAGGFTGSEALATAEVFDFATRTFTKLPDVLNEARDGGPAVLLPDGRALVISGFNGKLTGAARYLKTIEITSVPAATPTTGAASAVGLTTATLAGTVLTEARAAAYFQFGTSTAYGAATAHQPLGFAAAPQGVAASLTGITPSTTYHFRVVAENAGGTTFGADHTFTTAPALRRVVRALVPVLSSVKQSHSRWREGNALARASRTLKGTRRRAPLGTTFSLALNTPAKVTFAFTQKAAGRKVHGKCVARTRRNQNRRRCTRTLTRGTLTFNGHAGRNKVKFQGRISRTKKLPLGTYTLVIKAVGPGGVAAPQRLTFTIVR